MGEIPIQLLEGLSLVETVEVHVWWARLADVECLEIIALCACDAPAGGLPKIIGGWFIPSDDAAGWAEWQSACFEDLMAQPDPNLYEPPYKQTFYIG